MYNILLYNNLHPRGAPRSQSRYFSNDNFSFKFTNPKTNTIYRWKNLKLEGKKRSCFFHFHTLIWSNKHLKFHFRVKIYFRVNFTKTSFSPLGSEARAKLFTVLITWLGSVNFANLCHSGTSKGFWAVRVPWSEPDHHKAVCDMTLTILWKSHQKTLKSIP